MKVKAVSRASVCRRAGDVHRVDRNAAPSLHPFERAREYTRAMNATKLDRVFAKPFLVALDDHSDAVFSLSTHPTTLNSLYSGACDGEMKCWNLSKRRVAWSVRAHRGFVRGISSNRLGDMLVTCGDDKSVKLWRPSSALADPDNVKPVKTLLGSLPFTAIDHSWSGDMIASSSSQIDLWDHTRSDPTHSFKWGADSIHCVRFNRVETNVLASCASDRSIVLYDVRLNSPIRKLVLSMSSNTLAWNPMEAFNFTVANEDYNLYTFDMRKLDTARNIHRDHVGAVMSVDYSPTGREFVSGSYDRSVRIFSANEGKSREVYTARRMQRVFAVKYSADNRFVLSGSDDTNIRLWKAQASKPLDALLPREQRKLNYNVSLQRRFAHTKDLKRIARHRHLPKAIYLEQKKRHVIDMAKKRKLENRKAHSKPGTVLVKPARQAPIVQQEE